MQARRCSQGGLKDRNNNDCHHYWTACHPETGRFFPRQLRISSYDVAGQETFAAGAGGNRFLLPVYRADNVALSGRAARSHRGMPSFTGVRPLVAGSAKCFMFTGKQ
jgi:hypothetical protein